ncbi:MAG TPA: hypothetical protein DG048_14885 [Pseudoalteromonas sp.]|nr:hypothetical protein [Pseudoalteromonas sp.]
MQRPSMVKSAKSRTISSLGVWDELANIFKPKRIGYGLIFVGFALFIVEMFLQIRIGASFFVFPIAYLFYRVAIKWRFSLPFHLPISSGIKDDPNFRQPVHKGNPKGIGKASGTVYWGNDIETNEEIYIADTVMRQHVKYLGTTGSGKTVGQSTISVSYLIMGSGYSITDGKADLKLPIEHASRAWRMNRIDDIQIINYIRGEQDIWNMDPNSDKDSNAYHLYSSSSSDTLSEITKALLDGDGDIWAKRAESYVPAMIKPNVYKRDKQNMLLTIDVLSDMLVMEEAGKVLGDESIPDYAKSQLMKFIQTLPGMNEKAKQTIMSGKSLTGREGATILDQFGYVVMQIIPIMNMLAGDYGFIFNTRDCPAGHIDMEDTVINRRILLVLLPALETSPSSLASLGRITLAAQKSMMAKSLGDKLAGSTAKNLANRVTSSPTSFMSDNDEVGYYLVEGTAVAAAQARSIGFALMYCAQDLSAMRRLSDTVSKEVDSIWGNTNVKLFGRVLDNATTKEIIEYVGEGFVARAKSYDIKQMGFHSTLQSTGYSVEKESLITVNDLQNMIEGEVYFHYNGKLRIIRIPMLATKEISTIYMNDYITLGETSSKAKEDDAAFKRFLRKALPVIKGETITFTETNRQIPDLVKEKQAAFASTTESLLAPTIHIGSTLLKFDLDLSHYSEQDDFESVTVNNNVAIDNDGMPFADDNSNSSTPASESSNQNNTYTADDFEFDFDAVTSVVKEDNKDTTPDKSGEPESEEHYSIAEKTYRESQNVFDSLFGVTGRKDVEDSMTSLSEALTGSNNNKERSMSIIEDISRSVTHPNQPTLRKNPSKAKEALKALINVHITETINE